MQPSERSHLIGNTIQDQLCNTDWTNYKDKALAKHIHDASLVLVNNFMVIQRAKKTLYETFPLFSQSDPSETSRLLHR